MDSTYDFILGNINTYIYNIISNSNFGRTAAIIIDYNDTYNKSTYAYDKQIYCENKTKTHSRRIKVYL